MTLMIECLACSQCSSECGTCQPSKDMWQMDIGQEYKCDTGESPTKDVRFTVLQRVGGNSGANWSYKIKGDSVCCLVQPSV